MGPARSSVGSFWSAWIVVDQFRAVQKLFVDLNYCSCYRRIDVGNCFDGFYVSKSIANCYFIAGFRKIYEYQSAELVLSEIGNADGSCSVSEII